MTEHKVTVKQSARGAKRVQDNLVKTAELLERIGAKGKPAVEDVAKAGESLINSLGGIAKLLKEFDKQLKVYEKAAKKTKKFTEKNEEAEEAVDELQQAIDKLDADTAFTKGALASKRYTDALRANASQQRKVERLTKSLGERFQETLETFENVEGAVGAVELLTGAVVGLFNAVKAGAQGGDLASALNISGLQSAQGSISRRLSGRLSDQQAGRLAIRGQDLGLGVNSQRVASDLGAIAASRASIIDGGDVRELTDQMVRSIQDELAAGQIGEGLTAAGVSADRFNDELRRMSVATGQQIKDIPVAVREQMLLSQAYQDSSTNARRFRTVMQNGVAGVEADLENFGNRVSKGLSEAFTLSTNPLTGQTSSGALREELERARSGNLTRTESEDVRRFSRGSRFGAGSIGIESAAASGAPRAGIDDLEKDLERTVAAESATAQKVLNAEFKKQAQALAFQGGDAAGLAERYLEAAKAVRETRGELDSAQNAQSGWVDQAARFLAIEQGIDVETAKILQGRLQIKDILQFERVLNAQLVPLKQQQFSADLAKVQAQQRYVAGLTQQERIDLARQEAAIKLKQTLLSQSETVDEAREKFSKAHVQRLLDLQTAKAVLGEEEKLNFTLTEQEQKRRANQKALLDAKLVIAGQTADIEEQNQLLGEALAARSLDQAAEKSKDLLRFLKENTKEAEELKRVAGQFLAGVDNLSGGMFFNSDIVASTLKPDKDKPSSSGRGSSNRAGRDRLKFEARIAGLNQFDQERERAELEFAENIKLAGKDRVAQEAASTLFFAQTRKIQEEENDVRRKAVEDLRKVGVGLVEAMRRDLRGQRADTSNLAGLRDRNTTANALTQLSGGADAQGEAETALRLGLLQREQERELALFEGTEMQRLMLQESFNQQRIELERELIDRRHELREEEREREYEAFAQLKSETDALFSTVGAKEAESGPAAALMFLGSSVLAVGEQTNNVIAEVNANQKALEAGAISSTQANVNNVMATANAAGAVAGAMIGADKAVAVIRSGLEGANAAAAFAIPNIPKGIAHAAAAVQYAAVAASPVGGASPGVSAGGAGSSARTEAQRTALSREALSNRAPNESIISPQFFINPITGDWVMRVANQESRRGRGFMFDGRGVPRPGESRRMDL